MDVRKLVRSPVWCTAVEAYGPMTWCSCTVARGCIDKERRMMRAREANRLADAIVEKAVGKET